MYDTPHYRGPPLTHLLSVSSPTFYVPDLAYTKPRTPARRLLPQKTVHIDDRSCEDIALHLARCVDYICDSLAAPSEADAPTPTVLVQCPSGNSLAVTIVIAILMRERSMPYEAAPALLEANRSQIDPYSAFGEQLQGWEGAGFGLFERDAEGQIVGRKKGYQVFVDGSPMARAD
jgi:hypothetical protein